MEVFRVLLVAVIARTVSSASSLGGSCQVRYGEVGSDGDFKYFETGLGNNKCDNSNGANLVCIPEVDDGSTANFPGLCESKYCMEPQVVTEGKVTVCHRTCRYVPVPRSHEAAKSHGGSMAAWFLYQRRSILTKE